MSSTSKPLNITVMDHAGQWYIKLSDGKFFRHADMNEFACAIKGYGMPMVGLGTWQEKEEVVVKSVTSAIKAGYRLIDTARDYENEPFIGEALQKMMKENVVKRQDLFITTKLHPSMMGEDEVVPSLKAQLARFVNDGKRLHPVDPKTNRYQYNYNNHYTKTWRGMEACVRLGLARSIGLSNFNKRQVEDILLRATIRPVVLQIESHPVLSNQDLIQWCQDRNIVVTAYSPLGNPGSQLAPTKSLSAKWPNLINDATLKAIASKFPGKTTAQIMLRWQLQRGVSVIPKSAHEDRLRANFEIFDFELSRSDMDAISSMNQNLRTCPFAFSGNSSSRDYPFDEIRDTDPWKE